MSNCMEVTLVSHNLFPEADKEMSKCLTPYILSAEQLEMAQCLYFIASKVELNIIEINKNSDINVTNRFIKDLYDAKQILLKSMIAEVGEKNVREEAAQNFSGMILSPNLSTVPVSVTAVLHSMTKKKVKYGEVWELAQQAAQLAVEHNNHSEIVE
ncbi:9819_t:CDS:2 [Cetraspora pellucida]|uniref:9819_t:CDS:1 n=1 Tax=Cetraspora pellucida TaxID=1433469 RepID=A0ACA9LMA7_9GLOM|nr:9819_t:CDS:2 [Cetraspora pellucida]